MSIDAFGSAAPYLPIRFIIIPKLNRTPAENDHITSEP